MADILVPEKALKSFTCFLDYVSSISLITPQIIKPILFAMNYTAIVELTVNRTP